VKGKGLILAAPKSGSGKTLITAGLLRHLRDRGIRVAAAKCGPDYIDPTFHLLAGAEIGSNLDPWGMRRTTLLNLVRELDRQGEIVVCEGVMGLFDGTGPDGETGSTAELARLTGWPVVLIVDCSGQGASVAALVEGFARHDPMVPLAGLILNRVASERHRAVLKDAIAQHLPGLPVLGVMMHAETLTIGARHLGLVPAGESAESEALIARAAAQVARFDIDQLFALAQPSPHDVPLGRAGLPRLGRHIAIARDECFLFVYEPVLISWRRQGVGTSIFSPLADESPNPDADVIYLPGGYPELHGGRLADATHFLGSLREAAAGGRTIYGECGGYMVMGETLTDACGETHPMAGILPLHTSFAEPRRHLGYRVATLLAPNLFWGDTTRFRGHEFHYASIVEEGDADPLFAISDANGDDLGHAGLRRGRVAGSFIHLIDETD
jgi:cobyrinic acid a,c-diamide synthase